MTGLTNSATGEDAALPAQHGDSTTPAEAELTQSVAPDPDAWRREVAARLARYRTRRKPRSPHYPSLLLPFDASDGWSRPAPALVSFPARGEEFSDESLDSEAVVRAMGKTNAATAAASHFNEPERASPVDLEPEPSPAAPSGPAVGTMGWKVIEFPRSAAIPVFRPSPLADPIIDRPRIVEASEVVPPPPALGGILIETVEQAPVDQRGAAECLIQAASISRRLLAAAVDGLILATALCVFAAIFLRFNPVRGPLPLLHPSAPTAGAPGTPLLHPSAPTAGAPGTPLLAGIAGAVAALLWMAYQFLFVVYIGATPGLRAARLRLARFDGSPTNRRARRWRALASFLSAFSAGLGYFWCFLDQDSLCWHDRVSRTYAQSTRHEK